MVGVHLSEWYQWPSISTRWQHYAKPWAQRGAKWNLGAKGQKWALRVESLNPWSGCMGSGDSRSVEQKRLLGLPAGMDLGLETKDWEVIDRKGTLLGEDGEQREDCVFGTCTVSGPVFFRRCLLSTNSWAHVPVLPLTRCMTLSKLLNQSVPWFLHLWNGDNNNNTYCMETFLELDEFMHIKRVEGTM